METINVPLPEMLKNFVQSEAAAGEFSNAADYIQSEQKRKARAKVEAMMDEAVASGEPTEWTKQDLENLKDEIRTRFARRQRNSPSPKNGDAPDYRKN